MFLKKYIDKYFDFNYDDKTKHKRFFQAIVDSVKLCLYVALAPYSTKQKKTNDEYLECLGYSYTDLVVTCTFRVLHDVLDEITRNMNVNEIKHHLASWDKREDDDNFDTDGSVNLKRLKRLLKNYKGRESTHIKKLGYDKAPYEPRIRYCDLHYILLLSHEEYSFFKRFLLKEEAVIDAQFFCKMDDLISHINTEYPGYDKFFLLYKLERDSKLRMFCECLTNVKINKSRYRLDDDIVQQMLESIAELHFLKLKKQDILNFTHNDIFDPFDTTPLTISNGIVFGIEKMISCWYRFEKGKSSEDPLYKFVILNTLIKTVLLSLVTVIYDKIPQTDVEIKEGLKNETEKGSKLEFFEIVISSCAAEAFFDIYLEDKKFKTFNEYCDQITMTHFKRLYKIKMEPPRTSKQTQITS